MWDWQKNNTIMEVGAALTFYKFGSAFVYHFLCSSYHSLLYTKHRTELNHSIAFDKVKILHNEKQTSKRLIAEMLYVIMNDTINTKTYKTCEMLSH